MFTLREYYIQMKTWHENFECAKQFFLTAIMPELLGKLYSRPILSSFEDKPSNKPGKFGYK